MYRDNKIRGYELKQIKKTRMPSSDCETLYHDALHVLIIQVQAFIEIPPSTTVKFVLPIYRHEKCE